VTDFKTILKRLTDEHVNFVVVGAYAGVIHGANQVTRDLDICYKRTVENMKRLAVALAPYHPLLRGAPEGIPFIFDERTLAHGMNFTLTTDLGDVDLLGDLSGLGTFDEVMRDATQVKIFGCSFYVASLDALIQSKKTAGRAKDLNALPELEMLREMQAKKKNAEEET
jgi:predicted nucleotidyltransferase